MTERPRDTDTTPDPAPDAVPSDVPGPSVDPADNQPSAISDNYPPGDPRAGAAAPVPAVSDAPSVRSHLSPVPSLSPAEGPGGTRTAPVTGSRFAPLDRSLDATIARHPAGKKRPTGSGSAPSPASRLSPVEAARIAARSICPTCEGRDPVEGEEVYETCAFCASGVTMLRTPGTPGRRSRRTGSRAGTVTPLRRQARPSEADEPLPFG